MDFPAVYPSRAGVCLGGTPRLALAAGGARVDPGITGVVSTVRRPPDGVTPSGIPDYAHTPASSDRAAFRYALLRDEPPVVSIVTPFFNTGDVFHETARSVFAQSLQAWEWIVVNDASTDAHALGVLAQYRRHPRVEVVDLGSEECIRMLADFIAAHPEVWNEDIGE